MPEQDKWRHLLVEGRGEAVAYSSPQGFNPKELPERARAHHADSLLRQLRQVEEDAAAQRRRLAESGLQATPGTYVEFTGELGYKLSLMSLESQRKGIELVAARVEEVAGGEGKKIEHATVFVPEGALEFFVQKVEQYRTEDTPLREGRESKPKNQPLVASISEIRYAIINSFWTDEPALLPAPGKPIWWEVWLRGDDASAYNRFKQDVHPLGLTLGETVLFFPDRTVVLAFGTREQVATSISVLEQVAELRLAKQLPSELLQLSTPEQTDWMQDLRQRTTLLPDAEAPTVCLLDTGVNNGHPLLAPVLSQGDLHAYKQQWGVDDHSGHGTEMAGLAAYGDLMEPLLSRAPIELNHRLESVKILPPSGKNAPELYGAITADAVAQVEIRAPRRARAMCMSVTTTDFRDRGQPSSWSAEVDKLSSGADDGHRRLFLISAGNTERTERHHYPRSNETDGIHDPGQAWNALTVGAYTNKVTIREADRAGWRPVAPAGGLGPASSTALIWKKEWPNKPDLVLEGGNMALNPGTGLADYVDSLSLLTTNFRPQPPFTKPFVTTGDTSAATALAARMAVTIQASNPRFWPERKYFAPLANLVARRDLVRSCGLGVPDLGKALWSARDALTLILQDELQPFEGVKMMKEMKLHTLPWPRAQLAALGSVQVELRVTLSYFIEPNPGRRGWMDRYQYASHGLRFDMIKPTESLPGFRRRINQMDREDRKDRSREQDTKGWFLGPELRKRGSIHSDRWTGTAADLARRFHLAVFPVIGWWRERRKLEAWKKRARYSLIISIHAPGTGVDIYTPVLNQLTVPTTV